MKRVQELPKSSSRLIRGSQVITSVFGVVKELVENALDSSCTNVEVKLENYGLDKIEVRDNGSGINAADVPFISRSHYTSKITSEYDLANVMTYGFRGEALGALCSVSILTIITKTAKKDIGTICQIGHDGKIISSKPSSCSQGTVVIAENLFYTVPVRKQYYKSEKHRREELKKVEDILVAYACAEPSIRFALYHNQNIIWQKASVSSVRSALFQVFGEAVLNCMNFVESFNEDGKIKIAAYLPKSGSPIAITGHNSTDRCIVLINKRPVRMKAIDKLLHDSYNKSHETFNKAKYPISYVCISVPPNTVDVNFEPNKTAVLLHSFEPVSAMLNAMLNDFYKLTTNFASEKENKQMSELEKISSTEIIESLPKSNDNSKSLEIEFMECLSPSVQNISLVEKSRISNANAHRLSEINVTKHSNKRYRANSSDSVTTRDVRDHISTLKDFFAPSKSAVEMQSNLSKNSAMHSSDISVCPKQPSEVETCENNSDKQKRITDVSDSPMLPSKKTKLQNIEDVPVLLSKTNNVDSWSRGKLPSGKCFQPLTVLAPNSGLGGSAKKASKNVNLLESPSGLEKVSYNASKALRPEHSKVLDNIQNQEYLKRQMSGFDYFCRSIRLEVASLNPEYSNHQIAQVLSEKWNKLSGEEKIAYKNMALTNPKFMKPNETFEKTSHEDVSKGATFPMHKENKEIVKLFKQKRAENKINFSFKSLKNISFKSRYENSSQQNLSIIGSLTPGIWICSENSNLLLLNSFRLQEAIIYYRLLETYELKLEPLSQPIELSASCLNSWEALLNLFGAVNYGNYNYITDKRLAANGFGISFFKNENQVQAKVTAMACVIPSYGISDLEEILNILNQKGEGAKLSDCRPRKVLIYLQEEAARISKQCSTSIKKADVEHLIYQKKMLSENCKMCVHNKPFFHEIYTGEKLLQ